MHEERAAFHNTERSLSATSGAFSRYVGFKWRGTQASWRFPRRSWSLYPKVYSLSPWGDQRKPSVAVSMSAANAQLLKRMMNDPGISDDRSDRTAAASTLEGCVDQQVGSPLSRSTQRHNRSVGTSNTTSCAAATSARAVRGIASPRLGDSGPAPDARPSPPVPEVQGLRQRQQQQQRRRSVAMPGTVRSAMSRSSSSGGHGGPVGRLAEVLTAAPPAEGDVEEGAGGVADGDGAFLSGADGVSGEQEQQFQLHGRNSSGGDSIGSNGGHARSNGNSTINGTGGGGQHQHSTEHESADLAADDGHESASAPCRSRSGVSGQFIPVRTAYLTTSLLLSPPEVVLERLEAGMRQGCTSYENTRNHGERATKMLQALFAQGRLDQSGLERRLEALAEALRRVRRWLSVSMELVSERLTGPPEQLMLRLHQAWRKKHIRGLQEVAYCAAEELRQLVSSDLHPAPALLPQQLEAVDLVVRVRAPGELLLQMQLAEEETTRGGDGVWERRMQEGGEPGWRDTHGRERQQQEEQQEVQETAAAAAARRRRWATSLLAAHWLGRAVRGIGMAASEEEDVMLDAFRCGKLTRSSLELRLKIIAEAKNKAVAGALEAAGQPGPPAATEEEEEEALAAVEGDRKADAGGGDSDSGSRYDREYTGRVAYVTTWLVLQPPAAVCRAVAEAVLDRNAVVLRFHRRWVKETARRAHDAGLLSNTQLDELVRAVDAITPETLLSFLDGEASGVEAAAAAAAAAAAVGSDGGGTAAAIRPVATSYLTEELLRRPPADLKRALLQEWRGRTRDSVRYHVGVAQRRISDLYSSRGGAVAASSEAAAAANKAVQEAAKEAIRLYALARHERLTGVMAAAAAASGGATDDADDEEHVDVADGGNGDITESEAEEMAQRTAAATAAGLGAGVAEMQPAVRAAVLGLVRQRPTDELPPALSDPVVQHVLRNDLDEVTRTTQLADYIAPMGQNARSRLLLSVRRKLGRVAVGGALAPEPVAVAEAVLRRAVVVLQLRANEQLMLLLAVPPPLVEPAAADGAGSASGGGGGAAAAAADTRVVDALMQSWSGLPLSHKNSQVQGLRRNLRRAMEVGLADPPALRRAEELLRRASLQSYLVRNGYEADAAAAAAAAGAAAAEEAKAAAAAVALPGADFWKRAAAETEWGIAQLADQWRPLGPMARKRLKRRMLHSLDRLAESGEIEIAVAQSGVAMMRHATLALAREWRTVVLTAGDGDGRVENFGSEVNIDDDDADPDRSASSTSRLNAGDDDDGDGDGGDTDGQKQGGDDGEELEAGVETEMGAEDEEGLSEASEEEDDGGGGGSSGTRRAAWRKSPYFLRAAELAVLQPQALYERLLKELAATDYISRKRLLERTREQVRARFNRGALSAAALREMLTSIAAASNAVGRSKMRAAARRARGGRAAAATATATATAGMMPSSGASSASKEGDGDEGEDVEGDVEGDVDEMRHVEDVKNGVAAAAGSGGRRPGRWRRTVTNVLTPEQEAALPRAWEAIRTESLLKPADELRSILEAAWTPLDPHSHRNHHHYSRERLRQLRDSGLLSPPDYAVRMVALVAAARRARLNRGEVLAKPRGRCAAFRLAAAAAGYAASDGEGGGNRGDSAVGGPPSPAVVELERIRTALLEEYEADPVEFKAAAKEAKLDVKAAVGRNRSPALIVPLVLPGGGAAVRPPPPPEDHGQKPWLETALGVSATRALRVWATVQWRPYDNALEDNIAQLRVLFSGKTGGEGGAAMAQLPPPPLSPLDEQRLAAAMAELTMWYEQATLLRSQLHQLAMSKSRVGREKAAGDAAAAAAGDGGGAATGARIPRLSIKQQELFVAALQGRLAAAGVDLTEPEDVPLELKGVYGRPPSALEQQAAAAVAGAAATATAAAGASSSQGGGDGRSSYRHPLTAAGADGSPWVALSTEELVATGQRAEAAMDERTAQRLAILLQEKPTVFQLLASAASLRQTAIDYFRASGGNSSTAKKQLAAHRLRRRLDQLKSWGVIGPKRHVTQLAVVQQVSSAWPYLVRGATLDERGQVVAGDLEGEDELNRALGTMHSLELQLWLLNRWRPLSDEGRRMDVNVIRWRLKRLLDRGRISAERFDEQREAVGVVSARWRQIAREGLTLEVANKMGGRPGRPGAGRPRTSSSSSVASDIVTGTGGARDDEPLMSSAAASSSSRNAASGTYDWLRRPRRTRAEAAAARAAAAVAPAPKRSRGRPRGSTSARAAGSRVTDLDLEAAYESILESENGDLDPDLRSLIASGRRRGPLQGRGVAGPGYTGGVTGKRLSQRRWMSRATMPEAAPAAVATDGALIISPEPTAVAPAPAPGETAEAVDLNPGLLLKIVRLQQLVRLQQANLSVPQLQRLVNTAASATAPSEGQHPQHQLQLQLQPQPPAGAPGELPHHQEEEEEELEVHISTARAVVEQAQARLAEWRRRLPPSTLDQLEELDRQQQLKELTELTTANGQGEEDIAHSYNGNGNGVGSNGNGNGVSVTDVAADSTVYADRAAYQSAAVATADAVSVAVAVDSSPVRVSWMDVARRRIGPHTTGGAAAAEEVEAAVDLQGKGVSTVNGRKYVDDNGAAATAAATATATAAAAAAMVAKAAHGPPTSHPLEGGDGSCLCDSDNSDSGNGCGSGGVLSGVLRGEFWGLTNQPLEGAARGGGRAAGGELYGVWQDGGSAKGAKGAEAEPELQVEGSAEEGAGGGAEVEVVVDLEALRNKFFAAAPPLSILQKGRAAAAVDGRHRGRGGGVAGTRARSRAENQHRSQRVRK